MMKTIMLMAITTNGMIARPDGDSDFVTADAWKDDLKRLNVAGCCIMGYRTYAYIAKRGDFPLPCFSVVMTRDKKKIKANARIKNALFTDKKSSAVLATLSKMGFKSTLLYGGANLNSSFLKENLVDEFYLYVVPAVFGKGISLFDDMGIEAKLKLIKVYKFSRGVIALHYKVTKVAKRIKVHD